MHQQIRTSPGHTGENIRRVVDVLGDAGVNIEGVGPDFEPPHVRVLVDHESFEKAWDALKRAGLQPEARACLTRAVPNTPGALRGMLEDLAHAGYAAESLLVLASHVDDQVLVSIGIRETIPDAWDAKAGGMGGYEEPGD